MTQLTQINTHTHTHPCAGANNRPEQSTNIGFMTSIETQCS